MNVRQITQILGVAKPCVLVSKALVDAQQSTFDNCFVKARVKHVARSIKKLSLSKARTYIVKGIRISTFSFQSGKPEMGRNKKVQKHFLPLNVMQQNGPERQRWQHWLYWQQQWRQQRCRFEVANVEIG